MTKCCVLAAFNVAVAACFFNSLDVSAAATGQQNFSASTAPAARPKNSTPTTQRNQAQILAQGILKEAYRNIFNISASNHSTGNVEVQSSESVEIPIKLLSLELAKLLTQIDRINMSLAAEDPLPSSMPRLTTPSSSGISVQSTTAPTIDNLVAKLNTVPDARLDKPPPADLNKFPWPVRGDIFSAPGSAFREGGAKWQGILIKAEPGAKVQSIAAGKVVYVGEMKNLGLLVMVDHEDGYISLYGRNSKVLVLQDQRVGKHQKISTVDATENHSDIGLYFEIRRDGQPIDPRLICSNLSARE